MILALSQRAHHVLKYLEREPDPVKRMPEIARVRLGVGDHDLNVALLELVKREFVELDTYWYNITFAGREWLEQEKRGNGDIYIVQGDYLSDQARKISTGAGDYVEGDKAMAAPPRRARLPFEPEWVEVAAGPFLMGSDIEKDSSAYADEAPQHEVSLPAYQIGRYPVTFAQFRPFVEGDAYTNPSYWTQAGLLPAGRALCGPLSATRMSRATAPAASDLG